MFSTGAFTIDRCAIAILAATATAAPAATPAAVTAIFLIALDRRAVSVASVCGRRSIYAGGGVSRLLRGRIDCTLVVTRRTIAA